MLTTRNIRPEPILRSAAHNAPLGTTLSFLPMFRCRSAKTIPKGINEMGIDVKTEARREVRPYGH
jgi:hypothetical protein